MNRYLFASFCFLQVFFVFLGSLFHRGIGFMLIPTYIFVGLILLTLALVAIIARGQMKREDIIHFFKVLVSPPPISEYEYDDEDDYNEDICQCCGEEKELFYYTFELPSCKKFKDMTEVCTDCVEKYLNIREEEPVV